MPRTARPGTRREAPRLQNGGGRVPPERPQAAPEASPGAFRRPPPPFFLPGTRAGHGRPPRPARNPPFALGALGSPDAAALLEHSPASLALAFPVRFYRSFISPLTPPLCRFTPSCSAYALEALRIHGFWKGSALAAWRLLRCQPLCRGGSDPVPPPSPARKAAALREAARRKAKALRESEPAFARIRVPGPHSRRPGCGPRAGSGAREAPSAARPVPGPRDRRPPGAADA